MTDALPSYSLLSHCELCPKKCGANRLLGQRGLCGAGLIVEAGRAALHPWEEPCLSLPSGAGTVFFSHCSLQCVYCQNACLSRGKVTFPVTQERLTDIFLSLEQQGASNLELVTPTHYIPQILAALDQAVSLGFKLPVVYNSSGYERVETLRILTGVVSVYLPDFKYYDNRFALRYSGVSDYCETAKSAIEEMVRQTGAPRFSEDGRMLSGTLVRHLCLPGLLDDSKRIVKYLYRMFGSDIYMSIMSQYTPPKTLDSAFPEISRRLDPDDYQELIEYAQMLGIENAYTQETVSAEESFIPSFDGFGILSDVSSSLFKEKELF